MFTADRIVGFIAAYLNFFTCVDRPLVMNPQVHRCFLFTEPTDRFDFFNFVRQDQEVLRAFKQFILKIIL